MRFYLTISTILITCSIYSQTPCENGFAGQYPCENIELLAHLPPQSLLSENDGQIWANDIWGWTDPQDGNQYALIGLPNGTSFVDISTPTSPVMLGILPTHGGFNTTWRDIKVYNGFAFVVSEAENHGMQVFDLSRLSDVTDAPEIFTEDAHYTLVSNAHNININEDTGYAYILGATRGNTCNAGGLHIVNIQDPLNPTYAGCFDDELYVHDAQCVVYHGPDETYAGREICFNANESKITIADVTDKSNPTTISTISYDNVRYAHQGWLTTDHRYFMSNDEVDELELSNKTRTVLWDLTDLDEPMYLNSHYGETQAIDHNLYIDSIFVYQSNYTHGLRVLTAENISSGRLNEIASFDTYPSNNETAFNGSWSNYPYFENGVVVVSDITLGLFILRTDLSFYIANRLDDVTTCEGETTTLDISAKGENMVYQWQIKSSGNFIDLTDNQNVTGTTSSSLTFNSIEKQNQGEYRCVISNGIKEITSNESFLVVLDLPSAAFETTTTDDLEVSFRNLSTNGTSFSWHFGDGATSDISDPTHTYDSLGTYDITLITSNDCGIDSVKNRLYLGTTDVSGVLNALYKLFPVPASEKITLDIPDNSTPTRIEIFDSSGKLMLSENPNHTSNAIEIDITTFEKGLYFVHIIDHEHDQLLKFIKR